MGSIWVVNKKRSHACNQTRFDQIQAYSEAEQYLAGSCTVCCESCTDCVVIALSGFASVQINKTTAPTTVLCFWIQMCDINLYFSRILVVSVKIVSIKIVSFLNGKVLVNYKECATLVPALSSKPTVSLIYSSTILYSIKQNINRIL